MWRGLGSQDIWGACHVELATGSKSDAEAACGRKVCVSKSKPHRASGGKWPTKRGKTHVQQEGDLEKYGIVERCPGFRSVLAGGNLQMHSEACRKRVLNELGKDDPRVVANEEKTPEFPSKSIEEGVKKNPRAEEDLSGMQGGAMTEVSGDGRPNLLTRKGSRAGRPLPRHHARRAAHPCAAS